MEKQQIDKIIGMYSKRRSIKSISRETGLTERNITKWLKDNQYWTGHKYLLHYFDEFYFDKIDTEEKAYWLGFIYADGYLVSTRNTIGIELKDTDGDHLEKFKKSISGEMEVKYYNKNSTYGPQRVCQYQINSKHMKEILLSYYTSIDKTFNGTFPKLSNKELIPHLIRGFFDGDGCLTGSPKDKGYLFKPELNFIGTKETLEYIEKISGFKWTWSQRITDTNKNNYQINCGRVNDCLNFLDYMYSNATIYLDRKYNKYQELLENRERLKAKARV